jgi:geranylgeranyl pyrophosphate synthase
VTTEQWREILRLLREHRTTEQAYSRAVEYAGRAKDCLSVFPPGRERDGLAALTDYVLQRDR